MKDPLAKQERSALMSKVRSRGHQSTELALESALRISKIKGWKKHPKNIIGHPDFYFPAAKLAVLVDGCFWNACPKCGRIPKTRVKFWVAKIASNRRRDNRIRRQLWESGFAIIRIWEHDIQWCSWIKRLRRKLCELGVDAA